MTKLTDDEIYRPRTASPSSRDWQSGVVDIDEWAQKTTLEIIGIAGLGQDFTMKHSNKELALHYKEISTPTSTMSLRTNF